MGSWWHRVAVGVVIPLLLATCSGQSTPAGSRPACDRHRQSIAVDEHDEGPCELEGGTADGKQWTLAGAWDRKPPEGSSGDGPCIDMQLSTGPGAGWCDLPEARLIGEWVSGELASDLRIAWGPTSAGRIAEVRIEFEGADPIVVKPKPTPWSEFDYWFALFAFDRNVAALVALDAEGKEVSREDVSGVPVGPTPSPSVSPSDTPGQ